MNIESDKQLERIGEATLFLSHVRGLCDITELLTDFEKRVGIWWDEQRPEQHIYFVQYLKLKAGFDYIVYPRWAYMSATAQKHFVDAMEKAISRSLETQQKVVAA